MFIKLIRKTPNPIATLVYEPRIFEFRRRDENLEYPKEAREELFMYLDDEHTESILLFNGDEVWLTSNIGKTVDRWRI